MTAAEIEATADRLVAKLDRAIAAGTITRQAYDTAREGVERWAATMHEIVTRGEK